MTHKLFIYTFRVLFSSNLLSLLLSAVDYGDYSCFIPGRSKSKSNSYKLIWYNTNIGKSYLIGGEENGYQAKRKVTSDSVGRNC